jgi:hypothetical protein
MPQVFYVDHDWNQIMQRETFWEWECAKCGEQCKNRKLARGGWIYKVREPEDTRGQLCVVIENDWRE